MGRLIGERGKQVREGEGQMEVAHSSVKQQFSRGRVAGRNGAHDTGHICGAGSRHQAWQMQGRIVLVYQRPRDLECYQMHVLVV